MAFADQPLTKSSHDSLGRAAYVDSVVTLLERIGRRPASTVVSVIGQWGLGKSTILRLVRDRLEHIERPERQWLVTEFNPWYYQDLPSLQTAFFRELSAVVPSGRTWRKLRNGLGGLAIAVAPLGAIGGLVGMDGSRILERIGEITKGDGGIKATKTAVAKELLAVDRPILVIIDDVDRLDPQELLLLFKLIRLAGRLPNVYYLLAYDEDTLLDALGRTGLIGSDSSRRAVDYMEKIVQIRLDLPPVRDEQLAAWVDRELEALADRFSVSTDREFEQRFSDAYYGHIRTRLRTPRAIKRFFAQIETLPIDVGQEVDFVDFVILSWIRASEPLVYRAIVEQRSRLLGELDPTGRRWPSEKRDPDRDREYWVTVLTRARVEATQQEGVAELLSQLFPRFAAEWGNGRAAVGAEHGRIAHRDYFDRFFAYGVPDGDFSDMIVQRAARQIVAKEPGDERARVEAAWREQPELILSKLQRFWGSATRHQIQTLEWLAEHYSELPKDDHSRVNARLQTAWFGQSLFTSLRGSQPREAVVAMADADPSLAFADRVVYILRGDAAPPETRGESFDSAKEEFSRLVREKFDAQGDTNPLELPDEVWSLFRTWAAIGGDDARIWAREHLDRGSWSVLDLLSQMVSRVVTSGVADAPVRVGELDLNLANWVVGADRIRGELADQIAGAQDIEISRHALATPDNRRALVLTTLRRAAEYDEREST